MSDKTLSQRLEEMEDENLAAYRLIQALQQPFNWVNGYCVWNGIKLHTAFKDYQAKQETRAIIKFVLSKIRNINSKAQP